jgi:hypothetical protein
MARSFTASGEFEVGVDLSLLKSLEAFIVAELGRKPGEVTAQISLEDAQGDSVGRTTDEDERDTRGAVTVAVGSFERWSPQDGVSVTIMQRTEAWGQYTSVDVKGPNEVEVEGLKAAIMREGERWLESARPMEASNPSVSVDLAPTRWRRVWVIANGNLISQVVGGLVVLGIVSLFALGLRAVLSL